MKKSNRIKLIKQTFGTRMEPYATKPRKIMSQKILAGSQPRNKAPNYTSSGSSMSSRYFHHPPTNVVLQKQLSHIDEIKESYLSMTS